MTKRTILIGIGAIVLSGLLLAGASAARYTYSRQAKMAHNEECSRLIVDQPALPGDGAFPPCVFEIVPPSLWEKIAGKQSLQLPASGCNQSATTTDCTTIMAQNPPPVSLQQAPATTTKTVSNFSFEYPSHWYITGLAWEQEVIPGAYNISIPNNTSADGEHHVYIFTAPSPLTSINPNAQTLADYRTDYSLSATSTRHVLVNGTPTTIETRREVRVLSSKGLIINDIPMLRQRYGVGNWSLDANGNRTFDTSSEADVTDELRYVFFDRKTFIIITGWQADSYIDQISHSIRLLR